jgi:diguanylate cyclase
MKEHRSGEDSRRRFVRHARNMRVLGYTLGGLSVASVLVTLDAPAWLWVLLAIDALVRPHWSWLRAMRAPDPMRAESGNQIVDAVSGGFWVAAIAFNFMPSVVILSMLAIGKVNFGGLRFLLRSVGVMALAATASSALFGFRFEPDSSILQLIACAPFVIAYPVAMSMLMVGLASKVRRQKRLLERLVSTDGLTSLANRQHWEWSAERQLDRARADATPAALVMIDVDDFKQVNDRYGHILGDEVITTVAHALRDAIRPRHIAGRYAGDEFAVVMPCTDEAEALAVAETFRRDVARLRFPGAPTLKCTVSVGVAMLAHERDAMKDWIDAADEALYDSKRAGRNRVTLARDIDDEPVAAPVALLPRRAS